MGNNTRGFECVGEALGRSRVLSRFGGARGTWRDDDLVYVDASTQERQADPRLMLAAEKQRPHRSGVGTGLGTVKTVNEYLASAGEVRREFLTQDSGNRSYVVAASGGDRWIKVLDLEQTPIRSPADLVTFNNTLRSPLIPHNWRLVECSDGLLLTCDAVSGDVLRSPDEDRSAPGSAFRRFQALALDVRMRVYQQILALFADIESIGVIIEDFYDGCIIYDFPTGDVHVCDLDHLHRGPYVLNRDRQFGSRRFMAPEEFGAGSRVDWRTNVYTMGATGFVLLADGSRDAGAWPSAEALYAVLERATRRRPDDRYPNVRALFDAWQEAAGREWLPGSNGRQ
jgi:serine/threonine protein kinase, bacterial